MPLEDVSVHEFSEELDRRGITHALVFQDANGEIQVMYGGDSLYALAMLRYCAVPILKKEVNSRMEEGETDTPP